MFISVLMSVVISSDLMAERLVSFTQDLAPILLKNCTTCHGAKKSKGKYRLIQDC
jgi:hypothetical protein